MLDVKAKLTYADYLEIPDDERYELLNGDLFLSPSPSELHQYLLSVLHLRIGSFARDRNLGKVYFSPFDVVLSDTDVVQPDLLFISSDRIEIITANNVQGAPDLVVEILSPGTADRDRTLKLDLYAKHGVKEYWIVDPDARTIMVLLQGENRFEVSGIFGEEQSLTSPTLDGFTIALMDIFEAK